MSISCTNMSWIVQKVFSGVVPQRALFFKYMYKSNSLTKTITTKNMFADFTPSKLTCGVLLSIFAQKEQGQLVKEKFTMFKKQGSHFFPLKKFPDFSSIFFIFPDFY